MGGGSTRDDNEENANALTNGTSNGQWELGTMGSKMELDADERRRRERKGTTYQILMGLCANASTLGPATSLGYSAVTLAPLLSPSSDIRITDVQANWIAAASALGIPVGCLLTGLMMRGGRRFSFLLTSVVCTIGWLIIYMAESYEQILTGRAISGISMGLASVPATVYTAEIAGPKLRGTMVTWTSVAISIGIFLVYIFGYVFQENWRLIALACAMFPLLSIALTVALIPESPMWLSERGRTNEALQVVRKLQGLPKQEDTLVELSLGYREEYRASESGSIPSSGSCGSIDRYFSRSALIPFAIMLTYFLFQQFSGIFVIIFYAVDIIQSAGITLDPYLGAVLVGLARLISTLFVAGVSANCGRRIQSIVSGSGMTFFMGTLAVYLFLSDRGYVISDRGITPVICVTMYIVTSTLGFLMIPFGMIGEIYPASVRDVLSGLTTCAAYLFNAAAVKTYGDMTRLLGAHGVFCFYALVSFLGTLFVAFCLPETKGKTLREIEDMFAKGRRKDGRFCPKEERKIRLKEKTSEV